MDRIDNHEKGEICNVWRLWWRKILILRGQLHYTCHYCHWWMGQMRDKWQGWSPALVMVITRLVLVNKAGDPWCWWLLVLVIICSWCWWLYSAGAGDNLVIRAGRWFTLTPITPIKPITGASQDQCYSTSAQTSAQTEFSWSPFKTKIMKEKKKKNGSINLIFP